MATFSKMKASVYAVLRDSEKTFVADAQVGEWLNEAYLDLCARLRINRKEATGTLDANGKVAKPANYLELQFIAVKPSGEDRYIELTFVDDDVFNSYELSGSVPGVPIARVFDGYIETYPKQASALYKMRYVAKPTVLDKAGDEPVIPEELHIRMVNYARAHAKYQEGEGSEGDRYYMMYSEGLPSATLGVIGERPGPLNITPVPSWWDVNEPL
jgi:hypothetical protein